MKEKTLAKKAQQRYASKKKATQKVVPLTAPSLLPPHPPPQPVSPCLLRHDSLNIAFALVVEDFAIMYADITTADHLLAAL